MAAGSRSVEALKRHLYVSQGAERFELRAHEAPAVRRLLARIAERPDARAETKAVLRLMVALETRLSSPSAADRLREWLRQTPGLHPVIRSLGFSGAAGLDATRRLRAREGRTITRQAPRHDAAQPRGAVPLKDLFRDPSVLRPPRPRRG